MNFSADPADRKRTSDWHARPWLPRLALMGLTVLTVAVSIPASANVPLPRPRPAEAPAADAPHTAPETTPREAAPQVPPEVRPPVLSACRQALTEEIAIAPSIPPIKGPGGCGGEDLVRLEAIVLPQGQRVALKPAAILRCTMATAVADWIRADMAPLAASLGTTIRELDNFDSFECRGRNRVKGAKLSEHGLANALDVRGVTFTNGTTLSLTDRTVPRETREKVLASVCTRFATVLGPGSDWYHEDHIHLDLAQRRNNYKLCQWGVYDPLPAIAPLMPAERPEEAPPRQTAEEKAASEKQTGGPQ
ncbi:MAG: extensin family protein [Afipia sp. 62-7]|nr:extensin family protein [Afipia sp.]OJU21585.1 MAG: extensin family protein [Afipia sp. 62-7]